jgi:hypothetical protein
MLFKGVYFDISCQKVRKINCALLVGKHTSVYIKHPVCTTFRLKNHWVDQNTCMYFYFSVLCSWLVVSSPPFLYSTVNHSSQMRGRSKLLPKNRQIKLNLPNDKPGGEYTAEHEHSDDMPSRQTCRMPHRCLSMTWFIGDDWHGKSDVLATNVSYFYTQPQIQHGISYNWRQTLALRSLHVTVWCTDKQITINNHLLTYEFGNRLCGCLPFISPATLAANGVPNCTTGVQQMALYPAKQRLNAV